LEESDKGLQVLGESSDTGIWELEQIEFVNSLVAPQKITGRGKRRQRQNLLSSKKE
jgi:hypothetical protein